MTALNLVTPRTGAAPAAFLAEGAIRKLAGTREASLPDLEFSPHQIDVINSLSRYAEGAGQLVDLSLERVSRTLSDDPVARRLMNGLALAGDDEDGAYDTALRLALTARLLSAFAGNDNSGSGLQKWRLKRVMTHIDEHIGDVITLADLSRVAGLSRMYFAARFRAATGLRPHEYVLRRRIERAKELLADGEGSLVFIALDVGFQTQAHFTTVFKKVVGITPGRWRSVNRVNV